MTKETTDRRSCFDCNEKDIVCGIPALPPSQSDWSLQWSKEVAMTVMVAVDSWDYSVDGSNDDGWV